MNSSIRTGVRPAIATLLVFGGAACAAPATAPQNSALVVSTVTDSATPTGAASPSGRAAQASPAARAGTAAPSSAAPSRAGAAGVLPVTAAQPGSQQLAIGTPGQAGPAVAPAPKNIRLASYDPGAGTAVLTTAPAPESQTAAPGAGQAQPTTPSAVPTAVPSAAASSSGPAAPARAASAAPSASSVSAAPSAAEASSPAAAVKPGQLIASPPTAAAPKGALVAVTEVHPASADSVSVSTRPATVAELLGGAEADGQVAVDPHAVQVTPLVKDVKASFGRQNGTTTADASGTLAVDVKAPIPLPGGASAEASGSVELHPAVRFAYHGAGPGSPRTASIGFDLGAHAQWKINGQFERGTGAAPLKVPFAELHASPVLTVAGMPIVVNLGLTCFLEISADGKVTMSAEQEFTGAWAVRADYTGGSGWTPTADPGDTKVSPVRFQLDGKAAVRAGLGAEVSVGLYDTVGVEATLEPYLRAQVDGSLSVDTSGAPPKVKGAWALYGGVDLNGALSAHLKIFGTPLIEKKIPLPVFHREWPLLGGSAAPVPPAH